MYLHSTVIQIKKADIQQLQTQNYTETNVLYSTETEKEQHKKRTKKDQFADESPTLPKERIHLIWSSLKGDIPDFHQPHLFPLCPDLHNPID